MGNSEKWRDIKYREVFEEETRGLIRRKQSDPGLKVGDLEAVLKSLYIMEDQEGRGDLQDTILAAEIAAYESFIAQWKSNL
jgi:hypothetical protein